MRELLHYYQLLHVQQTVRYITHYLLMEWSSMHPGNALEVIGEYVRESVGYCDVYVIAGIDANRDSHS